MEERHHPGPNRQSIWNSELSVLYFVPICKVNRRNHFTPSNVTIVGTGGIVSAQSLLELSRFIGRSVLPNTNRAYDKHWEQWISFLKSEVNEDDPFVGGAGEEEKASLVAIMMLRRHEQGLRDKQATTFTAALRLRFAQQGLSTDFLNSAVIATARAACKPTPEELRERKDSRTAASVKLPVCGSILIDMKSRMWTRRGWTGADMRDRMTYIGCMWAFEMGARVSEYTTPEPGGVDHCIRVDDLIFIAVSPSGTRSLYGSELAGIGPADGEAGRPSIVECRATAVTAKGKKLVKPKIIGRRSVEESRFLDDLMDFIVHSGSGGKDELFSFRCEAGTRVNLRSKDVRQALKDTCEENGLDPNYFSSHSLRKGAITEMRSLGASEDDRRDRGNYAPNSQVMNVTYDYCAGIGPLASNSLVGGRKPTVEDVRRLIPPARRVEL